MKRNFLVLAAIILVFLLTSCSIDRLEVKDRIVAPTNNLPPLQGKWSIEKFIDSPYKKDKVEEESENLIGKEALFHNDSVVVGDQYILEPSYKLRNVNISDYLLYKFKTDSEYLDINEEEAQIITILGNDQYFYEFIKYNDDEMILFSEDRFYFLKRNIEKISKEEIDRYINVEKNILRISNFQEIKSLSSGVLLGIKTYNYDELNQAEGWDYKTIWIKANDRSISSAYQVEDLLVPRKKGFWLVDIVRENINDTLIDKIQATPKAIFKENDLTESSAFMAKDVINEVTNINPSILKSILYIGNDYISAEVIDKSNNKKTLQVYPIDYLEAGLPIMISDIVGETDSKIFRDVAQSILKTDLDLLLNEESFGLVRRNGYWIMKGRINYQLDGEELYKDYNIKSIPPKELINYDELEIPWSMIKAKVPDAIDAFTSPNEDIIIIETRNNILIYSIQDKEISQQELGKIKKTNSETIVMAEWAMGRYTNLWEEEVLKNEIGIVNYK